MKFLGSSIAEEASGEQSAAVEASTPLTRRLIYAGALCIGLAAGVDVATSIAGIDSEQLSVYSFILGASGAVVGMSALAVEGIIGVEDHA